SSVVFSNFDIKYISNYVRKLLSESERSRHSLTIGSSSAVNLETKDLDTDVQQSCSTICETLRVETPEMYISSMEASNAFSFLWYRSNNVGENFPSRVLGTFNSNVPIRVVQFLS